MIHMRMPDHLACRSAMGGTTPRKYL